MMSPHFLHLIAFLIIFGIVIPSLAHLIFSTGVCTETRQWDRVLLQNRVFSRPASSTYSRIYEIHRLLQSSAHTLLIRSQVSSKLVPRFVSILDYLDANHLAALVVPSRETFPLSRNSLIKTRIWFRSRPGKTCCNSLNGVPTSLFWRMCFSSSSLLVSRSKPTCLVCTPVLPVAA